MAEEVILPLIVTDSDGTALAITGCNEKSRAKTLERGELWVALPENGRVLPYRGGGAACGPFQRVDGEAPLYQVWLSAPAPTGGTASGDAFATPAPTPAPGNTPAAATPAPTTDTPSTPDSLPVLTALADLIAQRRQTMPEGSYTTHLFTKGGARIRKKTGEEAMEVILAESPAELTSEAADLLYHLMVLLEWEGVRIEAVIQELARR